MCCLLFLFPSLSSLSVCGWLIRGSNRSGKGYVWYGSLVFCFSWHGIASCLCLKQVLFQRENVILSSQYLYLIKDVTHLPILALSLTELLCNVNPLEFCAHGGLQCYCIGEHGAGNGGLISSPHGLVLLSHWTFLTKQKFKDKIIENFRKVTAEHQTQQGALLRSTDHTLLRPPVPTAIIAFFFFF